MRRIAAFFFLVLAFGLDACGDQSDGQNNDVSCVGDDCSSPTEDWRRRSGGSTLPAGCYLSTTTWVNVATSAQSAGFEAQFDVTPTSNADVVVGLLGGTADAYSDLAAILRFNDAGTIDARDGSGYTAASTITYTGGKAYHVRLAGDVTTHTYSAFVTPSGGTEQVVGSGLAFRTDQASVVILDHLAVNGGVGSATVCSVVIKAIASTPAPDPTPTPTPTPDPTPTPTPSGTITHGTQVNATNTGVPAGVTLTAVSGTVTITTPGTVWEGKFLTGNLIVDADNVTVRNCKILANSNWFGIRHMSGKNLLVENCEIYTTGAEGNYTGISGDEMTVRAVNLHGWENGLAVGSNVIVENSYIHDPAGTPEAHIDGIEWWGEGNNTIIRRNNIQIVDETGCVNVTPYNGGTAYNNTVSDNQFAGGTYSLYIRGDGGGTVSGVVVTGNVWVRNSYVWGPYSVQAVSNVTWSNNRFNDGTPISYP